ncbi:unnamed protein product [Schistosoma turkestanicum]|nr:unnamed protein product [Schistosoma turkestanicum]
MTEFSVYHGDQKGHQFPPNNRYEQFLSVWKTIFSRVENQLRFLTTNVFTEVFNFIEDSHTSWLSLHNLITNNFVSLDQIPTALLLAGVNTPDHSVIYGHLQNLILQSGGHVAVISPGANTTSVRSLVSLVVQQLSDDSCQQSKWFRNNEDCDDKKRSNTGQDAKESKNILMKNFTPATRFSYLALLEWYYYSGTRNSSNPNVTESNVEFKTPAPPTTPRLRSQRSVSQPRSRRSNQPCSMSSDSPRLSTPTKRSQRLSLRSNEVSNTLKQEPVDNLSTSPESAIHSELKQHSTLLRPLVIIFTEIESVPVQVLCDFIELTSLYVAGQVRGRSYSLPISFVFGLSTIPEIGFEPRFSASILSRLTIRQFAVPSPTAFLNVVLKEIIQFPGVHPTYPVLNYLMDGLFLCLDYSVKNFLQRLKFCMLEHYLKTPHPELLFQSSPESIYHYLTSLNSSDLARILSMDYPSLTNCILHQELNSTLPMNTDLSYSTEQTTQLSSSLSPSSVNNDKLIHKIIEYLQNHWKLQFLISYILNWLLIIMKPVSVRPLGKHIGDLYRLWLKNGLVNAEEFNLTINLLCGVSKEHLMSAIHDAYNFLLKESSLIQPENSTFLCWSPSILSEGRKCLENLAESTLSWYTKLSMGCQETSSAEQKTVQSNQALSIDNSASTMPVNNHENNSVKPIVEFSTKRKISLRNLRQHLQEYATSSPNRPLSAITAAAAATKTTTPTTTATETTPTVQQQTHWDKLIRKEFFQWLQMKLTEFIPSYHELPLYEIFYGPFVMKENDSTHQSSCNTHSQLALSIRRRLNPSFQGCLHKALVNPGVYLQIAELKLSNSNSFSPKLFDLCILYKLLMETTKMVNLYDWLMAFATILGEAVDTQNPPSQEIQCRFLQGLAELQYLGCIKSTRRKLDHVIRLTWISNLV